MENIKIDISEVLREKLELARSCFKQKDFENCVNHYENIVALGAPFSCEAELELGLMYLSGEHIPQNIEKAEELLKIAATKDNSHAQYKLAVIYLNHMENKIDEAAKWFKEASDNGYGLASYNLGCLYRDKRFKFDLKKSYAYHKIAVKQGNKDSLFEIALIYLNEEEFLNREQAYFLMFLLAENQMVKAQFQLGWMYQEGLGVNKDIDKAIICYKKAAKNGCNKSIFALGFANYLKNKAKN